MSSSPPLDRATAFCDRYGLSLPILLAPMAGASAVGLSIAVANAGGMGAMGALVTPPADIVEWARQFREQSRGSFQLNLWIPDPPPRRDPAAEARISAFMTAWGPPVPTEAGEVALRVGRKLGVPQ